jgi:acetyl-CoA acyltransferase 1
MPSSDNDADVVIVAAVRTPLTRSRKGGLAHVPPATLLSTVLQGVLDRARHNNPHEINTATTNIMVDDVCVGNVLLPATAYAALRMVQLTTVTKENPTKPQTQSPASSFQMVNRQCASGLQAVAHIANAIQAGDIEVGIGAGLESMSYTPMNSLKFPERVIDWTEASFTKSPSLHQQAMDCLLPMGLTSETVVQKYGLERHVLDQFAVDSHRKAARAQASGKFQSEIVSVGDIHEDDGIRPDANLATLSKLKPAFLPKGVTTAGNSSQTTDGAAAVLLMTRRKARELNLPVLGIWRGFATCSVPPSIMGIGPAVAIPKLLEQVKLGKDDIDVYEINEAFASQAVWCIQELGLDPTKVNPNGGAIALGHPLGATGARLIATILPELHRRKAKYGVVSMCIGTGMGAAALIEVEATARL